MSRIGKQKIAIPNGVEIKLEESKVKVKGPKGNLEMDTFDRVKVKMEDSAIEIVNVDEAKKSLAFHGLYRSLIYNMVVGVSTGFKKELEIVGVGYKAEKKGDGLLGLALGYSHPIDFTMPKGISFNVENNGRGIIIEGIDKQLVGQVAANIRKLRKPEPYKGKGVKYKDEYILRKEGKTR